MQASPLAACGKCKEPLPQELLNLQDLVPCPVCSTNVRALVFPAAFRNVQTITAETALVEGESTCFYHAEKKAVIPCESCGRFLCSLCDVDLGDKHICPTCVDTGQKKGKIKNLQQKRTRYDSIALTAAILPMLIFYFTFVTAPIALYLAIKHWNTEVSLVPRRAKLRYTLAIIIASLQIIGWIVGIYFIFFAERN